MRRDGRRGQTGLSVSRGLFPESPFAGPGVGRARKTPAEAGVWEAPGLAEDHLE